MNFRSVAGSGLLLLGVVLSILPWRSLSQFIGSAGARSSAQSSAAFDTSLERFTVWFFVLMVCSLALIIGGFVLIASGRKAKPPRG